MLVFSAWQSRFTFHSFLPYSATCENKCYKRQHPGALDFWLLYGFGQWHALPEIWRWEKKEVGYLFPLFLLCQVMVWSVVVFIYLRLSLCDRHLLLSTDSKSLFLPLAHSGIMILTFHEVANLWAFYYSSLVPLTLSIHL